MTGAGPTLPDELLEAARTADPASQLLEVDARPASGGASRRPPSDATELLAAVERARTAGPVLVRASTEFLGGEALGPIVRALVHPRADVKFLAVDPAGAEGGTVRWPDPIARWRGLPALALVAPADAPSARSAVTAVVRAAGPAYVQLPGAGAPPVGGGPLELGRARELRGGSDLTVVAYGVTVARGLALADALARAGISVRVLDVASVQPFDEAAVLRAARDTGAILTVEAAPAATGVGTLVAAMTAENHPVPVRRLGSSDPWEAPRDAAGLDRLGLSVERLTDEAWELLRWRGKVE